MRPVSVIAKGDVQAVGYREYVRKATFRKNIFGYVQNFESGDVEIIAEGRDEDLKTFLDMIHVSEYPIDVREFQVTWLDPTGEFTKYEIIRGDKDAEIFEQIDVTVTLLYRVLENSTSSLEKQDQMLEKQDEMVSLQHETVDEIKDLRKDSLNYLGNEFSKIKKRLHSIENALSEMGIKV